MILYRINNWDELYENNRSRTVKELSWVPIPNRHDGEHYSEIMQHKDAAMIFSAWVLILQVASRCQPRGSLVRGDKTPHTAATLSLKTRAPEKWFSIALDYLAKNTDWIVSEEVAQGCQVTGSQLTLHSQSGDEEQNGREQNGREGKGNPLSPLAARVGGWFNRKPFTVWTDKELKALKDVEALQTPEEDIAILQRYYTVSIEKQNDYRRRDMITLLNNWNGEIDRAKKHLNPGTAYGEQF